MTLSSWPPPVHVRPALFRARRRYHAARLVDRPRSRPRRPWVGLSPLRPLTDPARAGPCPCPAGAWACPAEPPSNRPRHRNRQERRISAVVREVLAAELPEAIAYLAG